MKPKPDVIVTEIEQVTTEVLAASIVRLSDAATRMLNSGLDMRALTVLLKAQTGFDLGMIERVLRALAQLKDTYTTQKSGRRP